MAASDPFWAAAAEGRLNLQWSTAADRAVQYPRSVSPYAVDDAVEWRAVTPRAVVLASTIVHRHSHPEFQVLCPFGLAVVETEAGSARLMARFDASLDLHPGDSVDIEFRGEPPMVWVTRTE